MQEKKVFTMIVSLIMQVKIFLRDPGPYLRTLWAQSPSSGANFGQDSTHSTNAIALFMGDSTSEMDARPLTSHSCFEILIF